MTFHPPGRYRYDLDNLVARMKAPLDGLASALGVDDRHFRLAAPAIGDVGGFVSVRFDDAGDA